MAESDQISRKRMRLSSSSAQTPTISKSNHIHNYRSGRILSGASRAGNRLPGEKLETKVPARVYPRIKIKDLRLRRVFSPASISNDWEFHGKGENPTKEQDKESPSDSRNLNVATEGIKDNADGLGASRDDLEATEFTQKSPPDAELFSSEIVLTQETSVNGFSEKKNDTNLRSKSVFHPCSRAKIFKNPGSFSYRRLLPYLMAADDATSSGRCLKPGKSFDQGHPNISSQGKTGNGKTRNASSQDPKKEVGELITTECAESKHVSESVDGVFYKPSPESSRGNTCPLKKTTESSPDRKSVCSKRKLFRTPGSVNYRRLLPYLRDNPEDNHRVPEIGNLPDTQKNTEDNVISVLPVSENVGTQGMVTADATRDTCSSDDTGPQPLEHVSESAELSDPDKEQETQVKHVIPDTEKNLEIPCQTLDFEIPQSSLPNSRCSSDVATSVLNHSSIDTLVEAKNSDTETRNDAEKLEDDKNAEQPEANGLNTKASLLDACVVSSGTPPSTSPSKGILRRNLRGCRGLCTFLNCTSFRLHAERAFEFSRNQLQDTEEMVLDLVGEMSYLRDMLEKHASANPAVSRPSQVREACQRAFEATEVAKSRLLQMNDDLQVHCRIPTEQRVRVKFARYVQEKKIPDDPA